LIQGSSLQRTWHKRTWVIILAAFFAGDTAAQTSGPPIIKSIRIVHEGSAPAVEILSRGGQVFPDIQLLPSPPRLVIDIGNSRLGTLPKRIAVHQDNILAIRADQYQAKPPVTRIVLDLQAPYAFSWDGVGNRLMVRLKPAEDPEVAKRVAPKQQVVANLSLGAAAKIIPVVSGSGRVIAAAGLAPGSSVSAGSDTAVLQMRRGGEVRICPRTTISVTPARNRKDIMLGMSTGALEVHDSLGNMNDSVITPDFRILFAGPGEFHFAISADVHGNTCVRAMKGNTASATVSEVVGDRVYQVKPTEQAVFHSGQIDKVDANVPLECGCPAPPPVEQKESTVVAEGKMPEKAILGSDADEPLAAPDPPDGSTTDPPIIDAPSSVSLAKTFTSGPETRPLPGIKPDEMHVQVDVPFVFTAKNRAASVPPAPLEETRALPVHDSSLDPVHLDAMVEAPQRRRSVRTKAERHGFFHRLKDVIQTILG
jgi:hypothetical protein